MSQTDLASRLGGFRGFHQGRLSRAETGDWIPDAGQMEALLRALGATEEEAIKIRRLALDEARKPDAAPPAPSDADTPADAA